MKFISIFILASVFAVHVTAQNKSYSIVFLNKKTDAAQLPKAEIDSIFKGHMANMERLSKEGKLLAAGPFDGGGGIFIMNSQSRTEVQSWIATDPGVKAKRWNVEILPYNPKVGGICPVKEPYQMTNYKFVRYDAIVSKFTATNYTEIMAKHNAYLQQLISTGNVITSATFSEKDGGILVMKGELDPAVIESDPGIQEGLIDYELKNLYIAKGSFCEQ